MLKVLIGATSLLVLFFMLITPAITQAQGIVPCGGENQPACNVCHVFQLGGNIINFLLVPTAANGGFAIVPVLAALLFAWGGFIWVTALGSPARVQRGREVILATIIGILIVYGAWLFINLFFDALNITTYSGTGNWWQVDCAF